jgi:serine phosphatase RsbU (regulator of sigma subunit)/putative methionine-R-sulfoxide reductase with GAF domain/anti-sigma regulatory factor (Ser/Thr protein kinase)
VAEPGLETERRVLEALQRVTDVALSHLSEGDLLIELLLRISEILRSDTAAILLLDAEAGVLRARAAKGIEEEVEQKVTIPVGAGFAGRVIADRRAIAIEDIDKADIYNPILREKGIRSLLGVPLVAGGEPIGVLHVGSLHRRVFTDEDRELLQVAGDRAALAIKQAQLFDRERAARAQAEAATRRLESLGQITDAALAYLPEERLLSALLRRVTGILAADTAAILLLDEPAGVLRARAAKGIEEEVEQGVTIPVGKGFAGRIAQERRAVAIEDVDHADILNPILHDKGIRSLLGVPLLSQGRVIGVLHVGSLTPRHFTDDEHALLQLAADRAALAIENALLFEQRHLAESIQRRLLPEDLNRVAGLELATRYLPASGETLGGDWYDAFTLGRDRVVLAVGDVVGHGVGAAAIMAQLRTALRAYAADGHPPAEVVERVNRLMWSLGPTAMTTLAYLSIDPEQEALELVNAGHPPPLMLRSGGAEPEFMTGQRNVALGAAPLARYRSESHAFGAGDTVLLFTDGLVETRGESIDAGLERLRALAREPAPVDELCGRLAAGLLGETRADDVAMIAARVPVPPERLTGTWPANRESLAVVRRLLRRWLRASGADADEIYDVTVAAQEACANAVEHAYGPGVHEFSLDAVCEHGHIRLVVRDNGRWRPPRGTNRGRGLLLMGELMDSVDVRHTDEGTEVTLERTLGRAAA